jgi:hypothetical protein
MLLRGLSARIFSAYSEDSSMSRSSYGIPCIVIQAFARLQTEHHPVV